MTIPFVQARWYHQGRQGHAIRLFVIHDMEAPEKPTTAEAVARYFSTSDRKASAHYCIDSDSVVQCVHDGDTAFGAAGANNDGLHFEQSGYASQSSAEWLDAFGVAMLGVEGELLRAKSVEHGVPLRWLTVAQVADGTTRGLCTHGDVSRAFPKVSTGHTDPGPNFPKTEALAIWLGHATPPEEDDMPDTILARCKTGRESEMPSPEMGGAWWFVTAGTRAWCQTQGNATEAFRHGLLKEGVGCTVARDTSGNVVSVGPIEVSPTWLLEKRPVNPIDVALQGGGGTGGNAGHFPGAP